LPSCSGFNQLSFVHILFFLHWLVGRLWLSLTVVMFLLCTLKLQVWHFLATVQRNLADLLSSIMHRHWRMCNSVLLLFCLMCRMHSSICQETAPTTF
jgi:hypothetical protein